MFKYSLTFLVSLFLAFNVVAVEPKLIGLVGQKRVGKDTAADYLESKYHLKKYAMATPMKDALKSLFLLSDAQLYGDQKEVVDPRWGVTPRELMDFIGVDTLKYNLPKKFPQIGDIYIKHLHFKMMAHPEDSLAICDVRFQKDVDALKKLGGVIIKITRPKLENNDQHISEKGVLNITGIDYAIENNGSIKDLHKKLDQIMAQASVKAGKPNK